MEPISALGQATTWSVPEVIDALDLAAMAFSPERLAA
jgi:hypothetical protein